MTTIEQMILERIDDEVSVEEVSVNKNNGIVLNGVVIKRVNTNIAPTIYRHEDESDEDFANRCIETWHSGELDTSITNLDLESTLMNPKYVYDHVIPMLINKDKNADRLNDIYYDSFLDLAIIYKVIVSSGFSGRATATLGNRHIEKLKEFGLDMDMMKASAMENMHTQTFIDTMTNVLRRAKCGMGYEMDDEIDDLINEDPDMLVLSTVNRVDGAAVVLDDVTMKIVHKMFNTDEVFIIPSSIHEVIAIPATDDIDYALRMIREVNETQVDDDEVLSDNLYISTFNDDKIEWRYVA